jgi:cytochrome c-type biogenesis protein CcmH
MRLLLFIIILCAPGFSNATLNVAQEVLAQEIFQQVRCVVCNGQTIAESDVELAKSMREQIRNLLAKKMDKEQIEQYLTSRYGDQILTKPPYNCNTYFLWFAPYIFLGVSLMIIINKFYRKNNSHG